MDLARKSLLVIWKCKADTLSRSERSTSRRFATKRDTSAVSISRDRFYSFRGEPVSPQRVRILKRQRTVASCSTFKEFSQVSNIRRPIDKVRGDTTRDGVCNSLGSGGVVVRDGQHALAALRRILFIDPCAANEPQPQTIFGGRKRVAAVARVRSERYDQ